MGKPHPLSPQSAGLVRADTAQLYRFFLRYTQRSFGELGVGDRAVVTYVAEVLTNFAQTDRLYRLDTPRVRQLDSVAETLADQPVLQTDAGAGQDTSQDTSTGLWRERAVRKHLGDYTLFMSGLFRAYVEKLDALDSYMRHGRQAYQQVSDLDVRLYQTGFLLFEELAKNFEYYSGALDYMRKAHFAAGPGENPFGQFLRRVEGWVKTHLSQN